MHKLTLNVPADLVAQAKHKAIDKNTTLTDVVTEALRRFVEEKSLVGVSPSDNK